MQLSILLFAAKNCLLGVDDSLFVEMDSLFATGDSLFAAVGIGYNGFMEILDLGHLHPLLEQLTCPRWESNPGLRDGRRAL